MITNKFFNAIALAVTLLLLASCGQEVVETGDNFEVIELPDGSLVYLNRNSAVEYESDFVVRTVTLRGEAFFDVEDGDTPFVVQTGLGNVLVMGTEFDVKAEFDELTVEVEKGVVEVKSELDSKKLRKGDAAIFKKTGDGFTVGKAEFKFKIWMKELSREFKKLGKEIKRSTKSVQKDTKKAGKELKKELKKLKLD